MNIPRAARVPLARQDGLVVQDLPDETLVYDTESNRAHCLNSSAAFVWRACDGSNTVNDIVAKFESSGHGKVTDDFVWLAVDQLNENGLLADKVASGFAGWSRRQVIKQIGLATVVAIPVVASLVAPSSALASSSCACSGPGGCLVQTTCPNTSNCNASGVCAP